MAGDVTEALRSFREKQNALVTDIETKTGGEVEEVEWTDDEVRVELVFERGGDK